MARKLRQQFRHHLRLGAVDIEGYLTVAGAGPVTVSVTNCPGVASVTRSDVGNFTLNLDEPALDVIWRGGCHQPAAGAMCFLLPSTLAVATRQTEAKAKTFKLDLRAENGTETDPTATDLLWVSFTVIRSTADQR